MSIQKCVCGLYPRRLESGNGFMDLNRGSEGVSSEWSHTEKRLTHAMVKYSVSTDALLNPIVVQIAPLIENPSTNAIINGPINLQKRSILRI